MNYQFIDKIKKIHLHQEIVIVKNVTATEDYFAHHFPGYPVMPGALQIEAMAQACGALIEISSNYKLFSILLMVDKMKFKKMIHPGDQLIVTATCLSNQENSALFKTTITLDGKVMTSGTIMKGIVAVEKGKSQYEKVINSLKEYFEFLLRDAEILP